MKTPIATLLGKALLMAVGAILGPLTTTSLTIAYHALIAPGLVGDGLCQVVLYVLVPLGIVLGAVTGHVLALDEEERAVGVPAARVIGWISIEVLTVLAALYDGTWRIGDIAASLFGVFLIPLIWSVMLVALGYPPGQQLARETTPQS